MDILNRDKIKNILKSTKIIFIKNFFCSNMFGDTFIIKKGTRGFISGINIKDSIYKAKYSKNVEVTYGNKQKVLINKYWNILEGIED